MNLILFTASELTHQGRLTLTDQRFLQIRDTHKSQPSDNVRLGELNGLIGSGKILHIDDKSVQLAVTLSEKPPEKLPLTVILALPRPKMIRRIFRTVAEMGVNELIVINSYKVEKSFWSSSVFDEEKVTQYFISGLQQAKDTVLPKVSFRRLFKPFVEDELPTIAQQSRNLIAHPGIGDNCPHQLNQPVTLAIGPEGGFTEYEVKKFVEAGFEGIHLGQRILRVENALAALISKLYS